jgi:hypothetical protein
LKLQTLAALRWSLRTLAESVLSEGNVARLVESAEAVQSVELVRIVDLDVSVLIVLRKRTRQKQR